MIPEWCGARGFCVRRPAFEDRIHAVTDEQQQAQNPSPQNAAAPAAAGEQLIEEYTLHELSEKLKREKDEQPYYCVDQIRDGRTKRKLIDPRSVLNSRIVTHMFDSWNLSPDTIVRVTRSLEVLDNPDEVQKTISFFADQFYRYLMAIFTTDKPSYKVEVQGLVNAAAEMLNTVLNYDAIDTVQVSPNDLRPLSSYYDHLVNTAVYWLTTFALINKKNESSTGSVEVWRSRNKSEMRNLIGPYGDLPKDLPLYYDIYGIGRLDKESDANKRSDMSLVMSGFFGALFHDLGLLEQTEIVISRDGHIDELLKTHVDESNKLLKKKLHIMYDERPLVRSIIKNHHERVDGKGYPRGVKNPHLFAQILAVCDNYDEYCSQFVRGKVIRFIARTAGRQYEGGIVRAFLQALEPYNQGETVDVYEGKGGEPVMSAKVVGIENKFRPTITVTECHDGAFSKYQGQTLDLGADENITFFV